MLYLCVKTDIGTTVKQEWRSYKSQILIKIILVLQSQYLDFNFAKTLYIAEL